MRPNDELDEELEGNDDDTTVSKEELDDELEDDEIEDDDDEEEDDVDPDIRRAWGEA